MRAAPVADTLLASSLAAAARPPITRRRSSIRRAAPRFDSAGRRFCKSSKICPSRLDIMADNARVDTSDERTGHARPTR